MSFPSLPLFLHPSTNWTNKQRAHPQLSNSFVDVVDGQYEAGAPVRPSESSAAAKMAAKPSPERAVIECPRCNSTNTKFCYYNNYSRSQPRHFCKTCRRYWTHGGALRNVPVGGGTRRSNKQAAKHSKPQTATANYTSSSSLSVASMRPPPLLINNNNNDNNDNHNLSVIHNFVVGQQLPTVGMAAPQPCPNPYTSFGEENVGAAVMKMEEIGYDPRVQFSYDPSNNNYNGMFTCGDSGSMSSCIAWPSGATGFSYGSSSPHHITFIDSDLP
ncbi:uncharacterized protein LOC141825242 [Curcuma longa]|uniref:uncharacterized protein LOC141825242 n=1 Tax=Curcuma longa TaxID=136217 RepID=UPI003D9E8ADF